MGDHHRRQDPLEVFWYVQHYITRYVLFAPADLPQAEMRWVERTIPRDEMIHVLVNAKESDSRGRGDPFAGLGWAKRLRDYFDAEIQKSDAQAAYHWWYQVAGGQPDLDRIAASAIPSSKPVRGSFIIAGQRDPLHQISVFFAIYQLY